VSLKQWIRKVRRVKIFFWSGTKLTIYYSSFAHKFYFLGRLKYNLLEKSVMAYSSEMPNVIQAHGIKE
jgi:hypothetical protein